jgi:hypothetical protein
MDAADVTADGLRIGHALDERLVEVRVDPARSDRVAANALGPVDNYPVNTLSQ